MARRFQSAYATGNALQHVTTACARLAQVFEGSENNRVLVGAGLAPARFGFGNGGRSEGHAPTMQGFYFFIDCRPFAFSSAAGPRLSSRGDVGEKESGIAEMDGKLFRAGRPNSTIECYIYGVGAGSQLADLGVTLNGCYDCSAYAVWSVIQFQVDENSLVFNAMRQTVRHTRRRVFFHQRYDDVVAIHWVVRRQCDSLPYQILRQDLPPGIPIYRHNISCP